MVMWKNHKGKWDDQGCSGSKNYVCEKESSATTCKYYSYNNKDYFIESSRTATFANAEKACKKLWKGKGRLARVDNSNENTWLYNLAAKTRHVWIGLNDIKHEGHYVWGDDCPVSYSRWNGGEPNNYRGNEHCVHFRARGSGTWNDIRCSHKFNFICEESGNSCKYSSDVSNGGRTYYFERRHKKKWADAQKFCKGLWKGKGRLAVIGSKSENDFVDSKFGRKAYLWIGASDSTNEGDWRWNQDCSVSYSNWNTREPNNLRNEDCAHMYAGSGGKWNDLKCSSAQYFVCEKATGQNECAQKYKNREYYFELSKTASYSNAGKACRKLWGGHGRLVTITTSEENAFIYKHVTNGRTAWLGGTDSHKEKNWKWDNKNKCDVAEYRNWNHHQPDNYRGNQDCMVMWKNHKGKWDDQGCSGSKNYVCEKESSATTCKYYSNNNRDYYFELSKKANFENAQQACRKLFDGKGRLVNVGSKEENDYIYSIVGNGRHAWLGANDRSSEGEFRWDNHCRISWKNFDKGEPNNWRNEDCVHMWAGHRGKWNDLSCTRSDIYYVCERETSFCC